MSATITLDKPLVTSVSHSTKGLMIELDRTDFTLPEQAAEISALELLYQTPSIGPENTDESETTMTGPTSIDMRELINSLTAFTVDATCQFIALAAAMPFVPKVIGKPIYRPLVRRLLS